MGGRVSRWKKFSHFFLSHFRSCVFLIGCYEFFYVSQQHGLGPFQAISGNFTFQGGQTSEKIFVTFLKFVFGKPRLSSDFLKIWFRDSQERGLMVFIIDFANFTWNERGQGVKIKIKFSYFWSCVLLDADEISFYVILLNYQAP